MIFTLGTLCLVGYRNIEQARYILSENNEDISEENSVEESKEDDERKYYNSDTYKKIMDELNIDSIDNKLRDNRILKRTSLTALIGALANGDEKNVRRMLVSEFKDIFLLELSSVKEMLIQMVAIILLGSIFVNLSTDSNKSFVSENGFFVTYMIVTSILLTLFSISMNISLSAMDRIIDVVKIVIPVYGLAMNYVGQGVTATGMYEMIFIGIAIIQIVIAKIATPLIKYYVVISLVNNLNKDDRFSKMSQLLKKAATWLLKTIVVFVIGLNIVKTLINPHIDALGRETIKRVVNTIPGGNMVSVLSGAFLGAGIIIKNSIGISAMLIIIGGLLLPMIKIFLIMIMVRITMVLIQPVGEKRYVNGIESLASGLTMLLHAISSAATLFLVTIALMAFSGKG